MKPVNQTLIASVDDIHRSLIKDVIGKKLDIMLLRKWATRLEMSVVPAESKD